jgi:hypothetical protein
MGALTHVAMSIPPGALTADFRAEVPRFYGDLLGWREMEALRLPDRLTISIGDASYLNVRERAEAMVCHGYEHFGVGVDSQEELMRIWGQLASEPRDVALEPGLGTNGDGATSFRFRYLLPMAVEIQYLPD